MQSVTLSYDELHFLLMQAAAFAIKQHRNDEYIGAGVVANRIMRPDAEVLAHRERIGGIVDFVSKLWAACQQPSK